MSPFGVISRASSRPVLISLVADASALAAAAAVGFIAVSALAMLLGHEYSPASKVFGERAAPLAGTVVVLLAWFFARGHYHYRLPFWEEVRFVVGASAIAFITEGFLLFAAKADGSRLATAATWIMAPAAVMLARWCLRRAFGERSRSKVLVCGREDEAASAVRMFLSDSYMGYEVVGKTYGISLDDVVEAARSSGADTIAMALSGDDSREIMLAAVLKGAGYSVILIPKAAGFAVSGMRIHYLMGHDRVMLVDRVEMAPRVSQLLKRTFDITVSLILLVVAAVPMGIVAMLVRMDGGPSIFGHERVGTSGSRFRCLKFRSMAVDADARLHQLISENPDARDEWERTRKLKADPRVTGIGRFIRKTAIDELPQLFNVLRGEMSLVGPRPVTEAEMARYGEAAILYEKVRPGVTGLWQVSGRNDLSYEERVSLDAWYVSNWSPWHDATILLRTVPALLFRRGAY